MNKKKIRVVSIVFLILMIILTYLPVAILTIYSFTDSKTIGTWNGFSFDLYQELFEDSEIMDALKNTVIVGLSASALAVVLGTLAAIGIGSMRKGSRLIMESINQITMVNADIVTAIGFMLLFLFVIVIPDDFAALIIAHTIICTPYVVMSVLPRLSQLNPNVYEAGLDLGATPARALFTILLPQLIPAIISGFALAFTISLDDFTISTFVSSSVETIPRYLYNKLKIKGVMPVLRALSVVIMAVVMLALIVINAFTARNEKKKQQMEKSLGGAQ